MRSAPCEEPRSWPRANRSTSSTDLPRRASAHVAAAPAMPPPTTTTSNTTPVCRAGRRPRTDGRGRPHHRRRGAASEDLGEERLRALLASSGEEVLRRADLDDVAV